MNVSQFCLTLWPHGLYSNWSNRQIWPWSTQWSRAKANRVLPKECTGHSKHSLPTTQEKTLHMYVTRWSNLKLNWLYFLQQKMEKLYTVSKNKTRSWCGSDHELLIDEFRLKLKKVGKTTRPFRSVQFSSVPQSRPILCNPMNCSTPGLPVHHQLVNTKIRLIMFFAAKDGEALYSQQKQDWELTVLLPNSELNWRK